MLGLPSKIVIFDTEFTCWEGSLERNWSGENEYHEIVQIGAIILETDNYTELDHFLVYVRPEKNPHLSEYFIKLTGIEQEVVEREGVTFKEALEKFHAWSQGSPLYSWGSDARVLKENAELLGTPFVFEATEKEDIRPLFKKHGVVVENYMSSTIPKAFGEEPPTHAHDALNDARSIAQALRALARSVGETT